MGLGSHNTAPESESATLAGILIEAARTSTEGDLETTSTHLRNISRYMEEHGQPHYAGIVCLNRRVDITGPGGRPKCRRGWARRPCPARGILVGHRDHYRESRDSVVLRPSRGVARSCAIAGFDACGARRTFSVREHRRSGGIVGTYVDPDRCASLLDDLRLLDQPNGSIRFYADLVTAENLVRQGDARGGFRLLSAMSPACSPHIPDSNYEDLSASDLRRPLPPDTQTPSWSRLPVISRAGSGPDQQLRPPRCSNRWIQWTSQVPS